MQGPMQIIIEKKIIKRQKGQAKFLHRNKLLKKIQGCLWHC